MADGRTPYEKRLRAPLDSPSHSFWSSDGFLTLSERPESFSRVWHTAVGWDFHGGFAAQRRDELEKNAASEVHMKSFNSQEGHLVPRRLRFRPLQEDETVEERLSQTISSLQHHKLPSVTTRRRRAISRACQAISFTVATLHLAVIYTCPANHRSPSLCNVLAQLCSSDVSINRR